MSYLSERYEKTAATLKKNFEKRGMESYYCATAEEAKEQILSLIPKGSSVGWGGSLSMEESGVMDAVKNGDYNAIDRHRSSDPQEQKRIYGEIVCADFFLMSTNAFTLDGELVNIDGLGNRVSCLSYGPDKVIVLASMDKLCTDVDEAIRRVHLVAAPPNALRVGADTPCAKTGVCADCLSPSSICCQTLITRKSRIPGRIVVVLTGEHLGF